MNQNTYIIQSMLIVFRDSSIDEMKTCENRLSDESTIVEKKLL